MSTSIHEDLIVAEEALVADVQFAIHNLMEKKGVSRSNLATKLGISAARVSQLFQDDAQNLTLRTIARIFAVLGEEAQVTSSTLREIIPVKSSTKDVPSSLLRNTLDVEYTMALLKKETRARGQFEAEANDNTSEDELVAA